MCDNVVAGNNNALFVMDIDIYRCAIDRVYTCTCLLLCCLCLLLHSEESKQARMMTPPANIYNISV